MRTLAVLLLITLSAALNAGVVIPVEYKSGGWEIFARGSASEYTGPDCFWNNWTPVKKEVGAALVSWFLPTAHAKFGRAISLHVMMGEDNGWYKDPAKSRLWLSGRGEGQRDFHVICAPDVTQLVDPNGDATYCLWVAVEYADGTRLPFFGDAFPVSVPIGASPATSVSDWAVQLPANYVLTGRNSRAGNMPGTLNAGQSAVVAREKVLPFSGRAWTWDKWLGVDKPQGPVLISWPQVPQDPQWGKVVKYLAYFGNPDAAVFNDQEARIVDWFSSRGAGQWDWHVECAPDVTQILDMNAEGKYRIWLAVEYESGRRCGYQGNDCPRIESYSDAIKPRVERKAVRLNVGYKPGEPTVEKLDIRGRLGVYLKEGRSWTTSSVTKVINAGQKSASMTRIVILKVAENHVEYQTTELDADGKSIVGVEPQNQKLQLVVNKPRDPVKEPDVVEESISVRAGQFDCLRSVTEGGGLRTITWVSKKFSGLVVKQISANDTLETTQELVEFKD